MSATDDALVPDERDLGRSIHFRELDSFRTIAAMALALLHVLSFADLVDPNFSSRVIYYVGHLHGMLFFPLSGFLVFRPIVAQLLDQGPIPEARSFLRKRFWRIFPAYWLVLTLLLWFDPGTIRPEGMLQTVGVYSFLHLLFPSTHILGLGQAWTLGVELVFYASIPFVTAAMSRRLRSISGEAKRLQLIYRWLMTFVLVCWALRIAVAPFAGQFRSDGYIINKSFFNYLDAVCLGMLVATMREAWIRGHRLPRWAEDFIRHPFKPWAIAFGLEWFLFQIHRPPVPTNDYMTTFEFVSHLLLLAFACTLMIFPFCFHQQQRGTIGAALGSAAMRKVAPYTYGFYLWHFGVIHVLNRQLGEPHGLGEIIGRWLLVCVGAMALGAITYMSFERPVLAWANNRERTRSSKASSSVGELPTNHLRHDRADSGDSAAADPILSDTVEKA